MFGVQSSGWLLRLDMIKSKAELSGTHKFMFLIMPEGVCNCFSDPILSLCLSEEMLVKTTGTIKMKLICSVVSLCVW